MSQFTPTAGVLIRPPLAWAMAILAGFALDWFAPLPFLPEDWANGLVGAVVFAAALALAIWAIDTMTRAGTNVPTNRPTTAMVESGPYRFTRNPMYVSLVALYLAVALILNSWWPVLLLPLVVIVIQRTVIAREERYLRERFPVEYPAYCSRVRRWL